MYLKALAQAFLFVAVALFGLLRLFLHQAFFFEFQKALTTSTQWGFRPPRLERLFFFAIDGITRTEMNK